MELPDSLFSGLGTTILKWVAGVLLIPTAWVIRKLWKSKDAPPLPVTPHPVPTDTQISQLSPAQIFAELEALPPLTRPVHAATFKGLTVEWTLEYYEATPVDSPFKEKGDTLVIFNAPTPDDDWDHTVMCTLHISDYPFLTRLHTGSTVTLRGTIAKIDTYIDLKDVTLLSHVARSSKRQR